MAKHHAKFIYPAFGMTLRDNQRDYYYYQLDHYFPGKRRLYEQRYHNVYSCDSPHAAKLYKLFQTECRKYGIRYPEDVRLLRENGTDAILIGETLMRATDKRKALDVLRGKHR